MLTYLITFPSGKVGEVVNDQEIKSIFKITISWKCNRAWVFKIEFLKKLNWMNMFALHLDLTHSVLPILSVNLLFRFIR